MFPFARLSTLAATDNLSAGVWIWAAVALAVATAAGFSCGLWYARSEIRRRLERARRKLDRLVPLVIDTLRSADEACAALAGVQNLRLTEHEFAQLNRGRSRLLAALDQLDERRAQSQAAEAREAEARQAADQFTVNWVREPIDRATEVPGREALDANLENMLDAASGAEIESGLLLIRLDRVDQLQKRHGASSVARFIERIARLVCRSMRDKDLACRFAPDSFAVLLPGADRAAGDRLAAGIRDQIRNHSFRLDETSREVLVTASLGYARCLPGDAAELVLDRAAGALAQSQRLGRNQLHLHDGQHVVHCLAG